MTSASRHHRHSKVRSRRGWSSLVAVAALGAIWSGALQAQQQQSEQQAALPAAGDEAVTTAEFQLGAAVFMAGRCFVCHGEQGFGGAGPRLRENRFLGLPDYVIGQLLVGRKIMPSFADTFNDEQIAAVATYVRNAWGNDFGPVSPQMVAVARQRMQLEEHPDPQPELPPTSQQPEGAPMPPYSVLPPGQPLPPDELARR